ncbi:hypothetical protein N7476_005096 [Penicillium atrosanguineum]|uniref:Uncharacterized protein n=1 Tax=Penicillium atrosanguineum TaxID=1132637 RepID=A0A9W9Q0V3_9EURO|nr:hypothetical protein N7476_005096 [Penicillium atrosanguineum]
MHNEAPRLDTKASKDKVSPIMEATINDRSALPSPRAGRLYTRTQRPTTRASIATINRHAGRSINLGSGLNISHDPMDNQTPDQHLTFSEAMRRALGGSKLPARSEHSDVDQTPCLFPMDGFDMPGYWRNSKFRTPMIFDAGI